MCYEFVLACDKVVINQISLLAGYNNFFLICAGHLNYFYCNDKNVIGTIKILLGEKGVALHNLSERETSVVLNASGLKEYEVLYGSTQLFECFQEKWTYA